MIMLWHKNAFSVTKDVHNSIAYKKAMGSAANFGARKELREGILSERRYDKVRLAERDQMGDPDIEPMIVP